MNNLERDSDIDYSAEICGVCRNDEARAECDMCGKPLCVACEVSKVTPGGFAYSLCQRCDALDQADNARKLAAIASQGAALKRFISSKKEVA